MTQQFDLFVTIIRCLLDLSAGKRPQHVYAQLYTLCESMGYVDLTSPLDRELFIQTLKHMGVTDAVDVSAALFHWNAVHGMIETHALNAIQQELIEHPQFDPH